MKNQLNFVCVLFAILVFEVFTQAAFAQDATKVDSTHYKVEFENDYVRVIRISYGPGEKSVMHEHRDAVAIDLTDGRVKMTYPDGKTEEVTAKAGQVACNPAMKHLPENIGDKLSRRKRFEYSFKTTKILLQELKPVGVKIHGNIAIVHYYYTEITKDAAGKEQRASGRWTDILMKQGDKWVMIADHGGPTSEN